MIQICTECGMPDTRPGSDFKDGICLACRNYKNRIYIDYVKAQAHLRDLCEQRKAEKAEYDCLCPVSGGKDSHVIVGTLVEQYGMKPLLITVMDEFTKTKAGTHNAKNIAERFNLDHLFMRHEPKTFRQNTLNDFKETLHPLKWIEEKIYSTPISIAKKFKIPMVFFGENSAYEYGTSNTLSFYHPDTDDETKVLYFFAFYPYNEVDVMNKAKTYGYKTLSDFDEWFRQGNIEQFTQIDSIGYIIQLWTKFPKYAFQRVCDITSRMVRKGQISKEQAELLVVEKDWICDPAAKRDFCNTIGITELIFDYYVECHVNHELLYKDANGNWKRKDLCK